MTEWTEQRVRALRRRLGSWFRRHARDLPWRRTRDAYRVWVSEIMLQQTQVSAVVPYYQRFLAAFPDVQTLAAAPEERVLRLWEGLGYYRRARQLHAAARTIVDEHGGEFPRAWDAVRKLPGIGRYTAGAILSIAFDARQPIVEANTVRLYSRLLLERGDPTAAATLERLWAFAERLVPQRGAGQLNQALMELGSLVCTPRDPQCAVCPLQSLCPTCSLRLQAEIPALKRKKVREQVVEAAVVVRRRGGREVLVRRRGPQERWAGMWDFPRFPLECADPSRAANEVAEKTAALTGYAVEPGVHLRTIKHGVTRFNITLHCFAVQQLGGRAARGQDQRWVNADELAHLPLSVTGRRITRDCVAGLLGVDA